MSGLAKVHAVQGDTAIVAVEGNWKLCNRNTPFEQFAKEIDETCARLGQLKTIKFTSGKLVAWDASLVLFLKNFLEFQKRKSYKVDLDGLPSGIQRLIELSENSNRDHSPSKPDGKKNFLDLFGNVALLAFAKGKNFLYFIGDIFLEILLFFRGRSRLRGQEFKLLLQEVGLNALPIVTLISGLVGLIMAFVSILQLAQFGATIYVADLVGIAMMREMGCIMTGVIISGRTGAAFAATIGSMMVNDEVDALTTTGLSATNFLVLPRLFALTAMMPFLCMISAFVGIVGGMATTLAMSNLTIARYFTQTINAISLSDFLVGIFKGTIFGMLIAIIGCLKGLQCGKSAEDVGLATTSAVVTSITAIIIADALFATILSALGI